MIALTTIYDYEDNEACIKIINSNDPTDWIRHIDTPLVCVIEWRKHGEL